MNIFSKTFKDYFFYLFKILVVGVLWLFCSLPLITVGPATAGYAYYMKQLTTSHDHRLIGYFKGVRLFFWKAFVLQWLLLIPTLVLLGNFFYFFQMDHFLLKAYAILCFYTFLGWILFSQSVFATLTYTASLKGTFFKRVQQIRQDFWRELLIIWPLTLVLLISLPTVIAFIFFTLPIHMLLMQHRLHD
ncbi:DUF624 domain-containing protein [Alkalicoccobacillus porphyridii]|uniref:DUF624 domain-containing protein n=1 Tax=Alkalicoccobacillus porphyridii TaxID=2597270 RepID=A0A553ZUW8_9BACI|nr:DUF624 domain-containing protein [Alkalicoccobacillus porphyridii]TSB45106.1 DUF624 domain-containing protein [Alkalicoccobacillus porphyridii]